MEGINHSSRERHSWSDRGRKRDKNVLSPFGSQGTLLWPFATLSLCHPSGFSCGTTASSIRPLCPLAALHYSTTSITACAPNDWRIRRAAAAARHGALTFLPLSPSLFLFSCRTVEYALERSANLLGIDRRKGEFRIDEVEDHRVEILEYVSRLDAHFIPRIGSVQPPLVLFILS